MTPYQRGRRGREYSRFYPPAKPRDVEGGLTARSTRGAIGSSWWSKRFIEVLEGFALGSRLTRGRAYARRGQVISLTVAPGRVSSQVQGSRARPYAVTIALAPFTEQTWADADAALAAQAIHAAALLAGEVPADLEQVFDAAGARLFPRHVNDLDMRCSCPDSAVPCKHLAATFYLLAERFDDDPFEILHWRGRPREVLLSRIRELRSGTDDVGATDTGATDTGATATDPSGTDDPGQDGAETAGPAPGVAGAAAALADLPDPATPPGLYWNAPVPLPPARPPAADVPADLLLRQLTDPPAGLGGASLRDFLQQVYDALPDPEAPAEPPPPRATRARRTS